MPFTIGGDWIEDSKAEDPKSTPIKRPIKVTKEKRRGASVTVIHNLHLHSIDLKDFCKELKQKLACGGSVKGELVELQGDHVEKVTSYLKAYRKLQK